MPTTLLIRRALPSDAEAIGEIRVRAWQAAYAAFMPAAFLAALDPGANLDGLRELVASGAAFPFVNVAERDGAACGFSLLGASRAPRADASHELWALNVHPDHWRQGIARHLVERALSDARALGARDIELWCIHGNAVAEALYERCGFARTGETRTTSQLTGLPLTEGRFVARA